MKKIASYFILIICISIYAISLQDTITRQFTAFKIQTNSFLKSDKYRYGDLYGMSYLSKFKLSIVDEKLKVPDCNAAKKIDLYAVCDSYLWSFVNASNFYCGVDKFTFSRTNNREYLYLKLDSSKINILLVEIAERNVRSILKDSIYVENVLQLQNTTKNPGLNQDRNTVSDMKETRKEIDKSLTWYSYSSFLRSLKKLKSMISGLIFNKRINTNIESNVWDLSIFTKVKELKSSINYKLFKTLDKDVKLSKNEDQLFLNLTVDTSNRLLSSFSYIPEQELTTIVSGLNKMYGNAVKSGFNKVYLSIIPNPVSILEPDYGGLRYNNMVNRIQNFPDLQMPFIDIVHDFSDLKNIVFFRSDTHWSISGAQVWLNKFNIELEKTIQENKLSVNK